MALIAPLAQVTRSTPGRQTLDLREGIRTLLFANAAATPTQMRCGECTGGFFELFLAEAGAQLVQAVLFAMWLRPGGLAATPGPAAQLETGW